MPGGWAPSHYGDAVDRDPQEFDLQLDWGSTPSKPRLPAPVHQVEEDHHEERPAGGERMRLVLALGESEVELRGAIDAIDARAAGLTGGPPAGALEEVREYIAAAFDAVRELTGQLVVLTDRLELAPGRPTGQRMRELIEAQHEEITEHQPQPDPEPELEPEPEPEPEPAPPLQDHADLPLTEELVEEFGHVAGRIERAMERVEIQQRELRAEFLRLADELAAYRRRVQVHARPPIVTDEQLQSVVHGVVAAMGPATPLDEHVEPTGGAADEPAPETRRRRRRGQ